MKKIISVIGARPQFIKAAPVSKALADVGIRETLVHTGQHYDTGMSEVFFRELEIPEPQHNLGVGSGSHAFQTGEIMKRLEPVLVDEKPDTALIYGDTNSTAAAALTACKLHIPVAHVEAGLRSFNRLMPEEINRVIADRLSSLLFAPTTTAVENLRREGITEGVHKTGDVMYDAALMFAEKAGSNGAALKALDVAPKSYVLATIHRAENTDDRNRLANIFAALGTVAESTPVVLPLHPRTRKMLDQYGMQDLLKNIQVTEPAGFLDMVSLESNAMLIVTDSGGVQKEAYFHKVQCVTLRDQTEWVETVEAGWNRLADTRSVEKTRDAILSSLNSVAAGGSIDEYGDGTAATAIVDVLAS